MSNANSHKDYPLTKAQEGIYVASMADPSSTIYNATVLLEIGQAVEIERLRAAIVATVAAHPYLETRLFQNAAGYVRQYHADDVTFTEADVPVVDAASLDEIRDTLVTPFDLHGGRLFSMQILRTLAQHYIFLNLHHVIADGHSVHVLLDDISRAYAGEMPEVEDYTGYDVALEEAQARAGEGYAKAREYYAQLLADADTDSLPDGDLREGTTAQTGHLHTVGRATTAEAVQTYCKAHQVSMGGYFSAAFGLVLTKYARKESVTYATIYHGRSDARVNRTVSMMVQTYPVVCKAGKDEGNQTTADYVATTSRQLRESRANTLYSFAELCHDHGVTADVMLAYHGEALRFDTLCGAPARRILLDSAVAKAPINVEVFLEDGHIAYHCEYRSDRYSEAYIESLLDAYDTCLAQLLQDQTLREVSLVSDKARAQLASFNNTAGPVEPLTVPQLLARVSAANADKTAVTCGGERLTYGELHARVNQIANSLIARGVTANTMVGLYMNRCVDVYAIREGIMASGGAFLSTEPGYPDDRISYIYENAGAPYVITTRALYEARKALLVSLSAQVLFLEDLYAEGSTAEPDVTIDPTSLAYCIYTSGSTGRPKGVMIEHRNLMNMLALHERNVLAHDYVDNTSVFLGFAAITFDVSIIEELMPLTHGQAVAIATEEEIHNPILLARMMEATGVDMMKCTPSYMQMMLDVPEVCRTLSHLRAIIIGAEPFPATLYGRMRDAGITGIIYNSYGPTETTVTVTIAELNGQRVTIGQPAGNTRIVMLDVYDQILPPYARGELVILGPSVGRGYVGLPEQTAARFITYDGERAYRSGDIAYWNAYGEIMHCGRSDNQVKLRGLRVELDEIENVMITYPGIHRAVVLVKGEEGDQYLCGYYVAEQPIDTADLRAHLSQTLTEYMIPNVYVHLTALPMTPNGKVDKRALPEPGAASSDEEILLPQSATQQHVYDIVADVVGNRRYGIRTSLTSAGLTSIGAIRLNALLSKAYGVPLTTRALREYDTVERLAQYLDDASAAGAVSAQETSLPVLEHYPLTKTQEGILVESLAHPDTTIYNIPVLLELDDSIDLAQLRPAIAAAVSAHPFIKTRLAVDRDGNVSLCRRDDVPYTAEDVEVTDIADIEDVKDSLVTPFELIGSPLFRIRILRSPAHHYLFLEFHHIIDDGTSLQIFQEDITAAYAGQTPEPETYSGYEVALTEARERAGVYYRQAADYYARLLDGCDTESLPDGDCKEQDEPQSDRLTTVCSTCTAEDVRAFCDEHQLGLNSYFTAAFGLLLSRWEHREEVVFAAIHNGRGDSRLARTMSMLVQTYPVRCRLGSDTATQTAADYIAAIGRQQLESMSQDLYSFAEICNTYGVTADVLLAYQGDTFAHDSLCGAPARSIPLMLNQSKAPLGLEIALVDGQIVYHCDYRSDRYSKAAIENLLAAYDMVLADLLQNKTLREVSLLSAAAQDELTSFQRSEVPYDHSRTVIDDFRDQAQAHPDKVALVYRDVQYTYAQLDRCTDALAHHLRTLGIEREHVVAVLIPRCEYMTICSIGVLKAGGAYLPLDPTYPPERLNLMVQDAGAEVLLTTPELNGIIDESYAGPRIMTDEIAEFTSDARNILTDVTGTTYVGIDPGRAAAGLAAPQPQDLFLMLYTSGSTGLPKGVQIEHRNVYAYCSWVRWQFEYDETVRQAAYASYGFDANLMDTYPVLMSGGTLYIIPEELRLDLVGMGQFYDTHEITHGFMTTQIARQFALMGGGHALRHLYSGGEKLVPLDPPEGFTLYNMYGPTETVCGVTWQPVDRKYDDVPIGYANEGIRLYIVDSYGNLLPQGAAGELLIAGRQMSRGYLNRSEQTAAAFTTNPFSNDPEYNRVYHTGDVVRFLADGRVQFIGRRDAQVKVRGFRIELTEVEEVIRRYPGIQDATVAAYDDPAGGKFLAAYVVSDETVDVDALNAFILEEKPPYMVPAVTMQLDAIPVNQNGKVNKRALPVPERRFDDVVPPQNETQQQIYDIIAEVVGSRSFGIHTDLTMAGLTSIGSVRLNAMLAKAFDTHITTRDLIEYNTVERLEQFFTGAAAAGNQSQQEPLPILEDYPLTKTQEGIFVECIAHPGTTLYNIPLLVELSDAIDLDRLRDALVAAVQAHPYIKTRLFMNDAGDIRQRRMDEEPFTAADIEITDIADIADIKDTLVTPYELLGGRLFRMQILRSPAHHYLYIDMHHIISDGTSFKVLMDDISAAYAGEMLTAETYSGYEAALTEDRDRAGAGYAKAREHFTSLLDGCNRSCLPAGDLAEQAQPQSGQLILDSHEITAEEVRAFCQSRHLGMNAFFTAVFGLTLAGWEHQSNVTFATIHNGRGDSRLAHTIAMLVHTYPVVCKAGAAEAAMTPAQYVGAIGRQLMDAMAYDLYSFAEISHDLGVSADVLFAYQGDEFTFDELCGAPIRMLESASQEMKAPLNLQVVLQEGRVRYYCDYRSDRYSKDYIERLLGAYESVARQLMQGGRLSEGVIDITAQQDAQATSAQNKTVPSTSNGQADNMTGRAPASDLERKFCEYFALALGRDQVNVDDDFFQIGGTSLSASKVAMRCMMDNLPVAYQDVFHHTTPAALAAFVVERQGGAASQDQPGGDSAQENPTANSSNAGNKNHNGAATTAAGAAGKCLPEDPYHDVLQYNTAAYLDGISSEALTSVLVTGATGFLGIHVVHELIERGEATIYCLVRGSIESGVQRLKTYLEYYFENTYEELFGTRIIPIVGDITDAGLGEALRGYDFDTIINCAACVKHFAADDIIERVNVGGVQNLIQICMEQNHRLVQISTESVGGESVNDAVPEGVTLTEDHLWLGQALDNQYVGAKYRAEEAIYQAIRKGLRAKVIRVGNLMSRDSDGEFQMNYATNGFMRRLRAYAFLGVYPVSRMAAPVEFTPIDATARAVVTLAGTPDRYTVFHVHNCHTVHMANVLEVMQSCGIPIRIVSDAEYQEVFDRMLADDTANQDIAGLISYDNKSGERRRRIGKNNAYTVDALYRLGFSWPLTTTEYMERAIRALATLGFYERH